MNSYKPIAAIEDEYLFQAEKYGPDHDAEHEEQELAWAALAYLRQYLSTTQGDRDVARGYYPFENASWKPENPRRSLVKAAAFIASELARIDK